MGSMDIKKKVVDLYEKYMLKDPNGRLASMLLFLLTIILIIFF